MAVETALQAALNVSRFINRKIDDFVGRFDRELIAIRMENHQTLESVVDIGHETQSQLAELKIQFLALSREYEKQNKTIRSLQNRLDRVS
jgi:hypothetical protein